MDIKAYKIQNAEEKFSTGGTTPNWTSRGKTWGSLAALKNHLRQFCHDSKSGTDENGKYKFLRGWWNNIPEDWVVTELSNEGIKKYSAKELYPETTGIKN